MSLKFYLGASGSEKSTIAYKELIKRSQEFPDRKFYVMVPDQYTMMTQKRLCELHPDKGILNIDVLSFGRLSHKVLEELNKENIPLLDDTGKNLILRKLAIEHAKELPYLGDKLARVGYLHEVKSAISEFMQYGKSPEEVLKIADELKGKGNLQLKLRELSKLYELFMDSLQGRFTTKEEQLVLLARLLPSSSVTGNSEFYFDGFTGFTPVQYAVIGELIELCKRVSFVLTIDNQSNPYGSMDEQDLFRLTGKTIVDLCKLQEERGISKEEDTFVVEDDSHVGENKSAELLHLEKNLFRKNTSSRMGETKAISVYHMEDPRNEVAFVLRMLKKAVMEDGLCYRDCAIVCGDLSCYGELFEREARLQNIPIYIDQSMGLLLNPFTEFIKSALALQTRNYSYEAVFHYLRSGLSDIAREDVDLFEQYVLALDMRGQKAYQNKLTRHSKKTIKDAADLEYLDQIREAFMKEIHCLYPQSEKPTMGERIRCLYNFLLSIHAQEKLAGLEQRFREEGDYKREKEYSQVYRLVMQLLEQMDALLGKEEISHDEFAEVFEAGLLELKAGALPQEVDCVVCGDIERTRLGDIRLLFFTGVNDGNIPKNAGGGGIISDYDRDTLDELGFELSPSPKQKMYIQRLYLYLMLTKPRERLVLSYSSIGRDGVALRPSYLIRTMISLFPDLTDIGLGRDREIDMAASYYDVKRILAPRLSAYAGAREGDDTNIATLMSVLKGDDTQSRDLQRMVEVAFDNKINPQLSMLIARSLYGTSLVGSVTQFERYASCEYRYFLEYGLSLKEKEESGINYTDLGTAYHDILCRFCVGMDDRGISWEDYDKYKADLFIDELIEDFAGSFLGESFSRSNRSRHALSELKRIMSTSIQGMAHQVSKGLFVPNGFEVSFSSTDNLESVSFDLSDDEKVRLMGSIDRVDSCLSEGKVLVKVTDYKSSDKEVDLVSIYHGLSLQLVVYLNVAMELEQRKWPDMQIAPAGILYYHLQDPIIEEKTVLGPDEIQEKIYKQLRLRGLINDSKEVLSLIDSDIEVKGSSDVIYAKISKEGNLGASKELVSEADLRTVSSYVNKKLRDISSGILNGAIDRKPYVYGDKKACTYCKYKEACGLDKTRGDEERNINKEDNETIIKKMREVGGEG